MWVVERLAVDARPVRVSRECPSTRTLDIDLPEARGWLDDVQVRGTGV